MPTHSFRSDGREAIVVFPGSQRAFLSTVLSTEDDRRLRIRGRDGGEMTVFRDQVRRAKPREVTTGKIDA